MEIIKRVIDKYFDFRAEKGGADFITELIPKSMLDSTRKSNFEGISYWKAIPSIVSSAEIKALEKLYKHPLPESYKVFLQHRHFIEMQLGKQQIGFFENLPNALTTKVEADFLDSNTALLERNYLPFARISDYGYACFDANASVKKLKYPIVALTGLDGYDKAEFIASNFESMFEEFDQHLDEKIKKYRTSK